jgi:hypothetical protein
MKKVLIQTTIPYAKDDWSVERFSMLAKILSDEPDSFGNPKYFVAARNRENLAGGDDRILSKLDTSDFDELWLLGVDVGGGLSAGDCAAVGRFRERGGGVLTSRDHQDLGISFCALGGIGSAHHFHSKNPEADSSRLNVDDTESPSISWPNYHSGKNGDFQRVEVVGPVHPVMQNQSNPSGRIELLPAHPHEGAVSPLDGDQSVRVIAQGTSSLTGRQFNLAVAFEREDNRGRAIADSSFHHFLDYNFDPGLGCPSFVTERSGRGMLENPKAFVDAKTYILNIADWLAA